MQFTCISYLRNSHFFLFVSISDEIEKFRDWWIPFTWSLQTRKMYRPKSGKLLAKPSFKMRMVLEVWLFMMFISYIKKEFFLLSLTDYRRVGTVTENSWILMCIATVWKSYPLSRWIKHNHPVIKNAWSRWVTFYVQIFYMYSVFILCLTAKNVCF